MHNTQETALMNYDLLHEKDIAHIASLVERYPFNAYRRYRLFSEKEIHTHLSSSIHTLIKERPDALFACARDGDTIRGIISLIPLSWDSECFSMPMACIGHCIVDPTHADSFSLSYQLIGFILSLGKQKKIRHIACHVDVSNIPGMHALSKSNFNLIDTGVTYSIHASGRMPHYKSLCHIRAFRENDLPTVCRLAEERFLKSRFYKDPFLSRDGANKLHQKWVKTYAREQNTHTLWIAERDKEIIGFIGYKKDEARRVCGIKLIDSVLYMVLPSAKGAGPALIQKMFDDMHASSYDLIDIKTQLDNFESTRIFQKYNLALMRAEHTFHYLADSMRP